MGKPKSYNDRRERLADMVAKDCNNEVMRHSKTSSANTDLYFPDILALSGVLFGSTKMFWPFKESCENPHSIVTMNRAILWAIWQVLLTVDFENRDEKWIYVSRIVKELLI